MSRTWDERCHSWEELRSHRLPSTFMPDEYLEDELKRYTHTVLLEDFLTHALGFNSEHWEPKVRNWGIGDTTQYKDILRAYNSHDCEDDQYSLFSNLANHVIDQFQLFMPHGWNEIQLRFRAMGSTGRFGRSKPDIVGTHRDNSVGELGWWQPYFVVEFGEKYRASEANSDEDEIGSTTTRPRYANGREGLQGAGSEGSHLELGQANRHPSGALPLLPPDEEYTGAQVKLAKLALQMMSSGTFREWVISFLIDEENFTFWYYDRSCAVSAMTFNWKIDWVNFTMCIIALSVCSRKRFGLDTLFEPSTSSEFGYGGELAFEKVQFELVHEEVSNGQNSVPKFDWDGGMVCRLKHRIDRQATLFGRGTIVDEVTVGKVDNGAWVSLCRDAELVMKLLWQVETRNKEYEIIKKARAVDPEHTPAVFAHAISVRELPSDELQRCWKAPSGDKWERRVLVLMIRRKYAMAYSLTGDDFKDVYRDNLICHRKLYLPANILHRNISVSNLMAYKDVNGAWVGVLDTSVMLNPDTEPPGAASKYRTGNATFMACELLSPVSSVIQTEQCYAHDLESFFYVMVWVTVGYDGQNIPPCLSTWADGNWNQVRKWKSMFFVDYDLYFKDVVPGHVNSLQEFANSCGVFIDASIAVGNAKFEFWKHNPTMVTQGQDVISKTIGKLGHDTYTRLVTWERYAAAVGVASDVIEELKEDTSG